MPKSMDMAHKLAYSLLCRVVVSNCKPNRGHYAIAALENRCRKEGKVFRFTYFHIFLNYKNSDGIFLVFHSILRNHFDSRVYIQNNVFFRILMDSIKRLGVQQ